MGNSPLFLLNEFKRMIDLEQRIAEIIDPTLSGKGFRIVRVQLQGAKRKTLQIMIERTDNQPISVDDCALASHAVSVLLDVEDLIHESYVLEVTSPGFDRPLTFKQDFERFTGSFVKIELKTPHEGSRRFKGILLGIEEDFVKIELDPHKEVADFAFSDIQKAKIIPDYEISKSN